MKGIVPRGAYSLLTLLMRLLSYPSVSLLNAFLLFLCFSNQEILKFILLLFLLSGCLLISYTAHICILEVIAEFTAHSVQTLHKLGQLTLIAASDVDEVYFLRFLEVVGDRINFFANVFVQKINNFPEEGDKVIFSFLSIIYSFLDISSLVARKVFLREDMFFKVEDMITGVFLASEDGFTYVQQSVRLLGPLIAQSTTRE